MDRKTWNRIGLAALILLAPGGFVLGAGLAARQWRKRQASASPAPPPDEKAAGALPHRPGGPQEEPR